MDPTGDDGGEELASVVSSVGVDGEVAAGQGADEGYQDFIASIQGSTSSPSVDLRR